MYSHVSCVLATILHFSMPVPSVASIHEQVQSRVPNPPSGHLLLPTNHRIAPLRRGPVPNPPSQLGARHPVEPSSPPSQDVKYQPPAPRPASLASEP